MKLLFESRDGPALFPNELNNMIDRTHRVVLLEKIAEAIDSPANFLFGGQSAMTWPPTMLSHPIAADIARNFGHEAALVRCPLA